MLITKHFTLMMLYGMGPLDSLKVPCSSPLVAPGEVLAGKLPWIRELSKLN